MKNNYRVYSEEEENALNAFCEANGIKRNNDEFYFTIDGQKYRVSRYAIRTTSTKEHTLIEKKKVEKSTIYIKAKRSELKKIYESIKDGSYFEKKEEVKVKEPEKEVTPPGVSETKKPLSSKEKQQLLMKQLLGRR